MSNSLDLLRSVPVYSQNCTWELAYHLSPFLFHTNTFNPLTFQTNSPLYVHELLLFCKNKAKINKIHGYLSACAVRMLGLLWMLCLDSNGGAVDMFRIHLFWWGEVLSPCCSCYRACHSCHCSLDTYVKPAERPRMRCSDLCIRHWKTRQPMEFVCSPVCLLHSKSVTIKGNDMPHEGFPSFKGKGNGNKRLCFFQNTLQMVGLTHHPIVWERPGQSKKCQCLSVCAQSTWPIRRRTATRYRLTTKSLRVSMLAHLEHGCFLLVRRKSIIFIWVIDSSRVHVWVGFGNFNLECLQ